jgi:hypothetical protein
MSKNRQASHQPAQVGQQATDPYQRPITQHDQTLALTYNLGEPLEKYMAGPPRGNAILRWLLFLSFFLLGLLFTATAIYQWLNPQQAGFTGDPGSICGGIVFSLIGPIMLATSLGYSPLWPHIATRYLICTDGFLRVRPLAFKSRVLAIRWKQISAYYTDGRRLKLSIGDEEGGGQSRSVILVPVGSYRRTASRMGSSITDRIAKRIRPQLQRFWQTGEPLTFGSFTVSRDGIQYKEQSFPWEEIRACTIVFKSNKLVFVLGTRGNRALATHECFQIPNVYELGGLIDAELTMRIAEKKMKKGERRTSEDA